MFNNPQEVIVFFLKSEEIRSFFISRKRLDTKQPQGGFFGGIISTGSYFPGWGGYFLRGGISHVYFPPDGFLMGVGRVVALQSLLTFKKGTKTFNLQTNNKTRLINVINKTPTVVRARALFYCKLHIVKI